MQFQSDKKKLRLEYSLLGRYAVWTGKQLTFRRSVAQGQVVQEMHNYHPLKMETLHSSQTTVFTRQQL
jgi:hypothetical protein